MNRFLNRTGFLILLVLTGHVILPLIFVAQMVTGVRSNSLSWYLSFYTATSYIAMMFFIGAWSWLGNATRYAWPVLLILVSAATFPYDHFQLSLSSLAAVEPAISICVGTIFIAVLVIALLGRRTDMPAVELSFPLHGGAYMVAQGGGSRIINFHVLSPAQRYALDILKLNAVGLRARSLYPHDLERYAIYGAEVLSPCDGSVAAAEDGFMDLPPPECDPEHRAGNYVAIEFGGATIYLAHLMKGSLRVRLGQQVRKGEAVGRVGNSGNTTEPHLHIHAEEGPYPGQFSGRPGIPMRFNGRFLMRNDCVKVPVRTRQ